MGNEDRLTSMPLLTPTPTLEHVLQGLQESEIRCGIQNEPPAGGITAGIDFGSRTEKATFYGTFVGDKEVWPAADCIAAWLHETCAFSLKAPMLRATATEGLARWLIAELAAIEGDRPVQWVMLLDVMPALGATWEEAEQAADFAAVGKPFRSEGGRCCSSCSEIAPRTSRQLKGFSTN
jgi:hypothetical protein